ncbi:MAG TPA: hypothetical protein VK879_18595 [Candidatus Sulfomarinibacteraceae bacterium]|nr:hypothetical protein [Candidatus Sulfomarinibacteraceae bacterium]
MTMDGESKKVIILLSTIVIVVGLLLAILYARQRLFTRSEPIVLSS